MDYSSSCGSSTQRPIDKIINNLSHAVEELDKTREIVHGTVSSLVGCAPTVGQECPKSPSPTCLFETIEQLIVRIVEMSDSIRCQITRV